MHLLKKLLFLFILFYASKAFSQNTGFAPVGATWHYKVMHSIIEERMLIVLKSEKDTVINNSICRKIGVTNFYNNGQKKLAPVIIKDSFNKIYLWNEDKFHLALDFNSTTGDKWVIGNLWADTAYVISTDSVKIDNIFYKRLVVNYHNNKTYRDTFISTIGGMHSLLPPSLNTVPKFQMYNLNCYQDSSIFLKREVTCDTMDGMTIGIAELDRQQSNILYPNPCKDFIVYKGLKNYTEKARISVVNIQGKLMLQYYNYSPEGKIDISMLPTGVYSLTIEIEEKIYHHKIIKL